MTFSISIEDLLGTSAPFVYYNFLPTDEYTLAGDWPDYDLKQLAHSLLCLDNFNEIDHSQIDDLTLALVKNGSHPLPLEINWDDVARLFVDLYAHNLLPGGSRVLRMKSARLNYFLRSLTAFDEYLNPKSLTSTSLPDKHIWDFLYHGNELIYINSSSLNFHYSKLPHSRGIKAGLPTQIDLLNENELAISSCYSSGSYRFSFDSLELIHLPHTTSIVLEFSFCNQTYFLDRNGVLYRHSLDTPIYTFILNNVWRARFIDGQLYVADWSLVGVLFSLSLYTMSLSKINVSPVALVNDICCVDSSFYLLDKMQGSVFAFDKFFNFRNKYLGFGKGCCNLFDPISIRYHDKLLHVSNWLSNSLVSFKPF